MADEILKLKIGRHEYSIGPNDVFLDNSACVQLLTQSKERSTWGRRPHPILSKRAVKEIQQFSRVELEHGYAKSVSVFKLKKGDK